MRLQRLFHPGIVALSALLFAHPVHAASIERVSVSSAEIQGNQRSYQGSMSADGRFVAFYSDARNLVPNDNNNETDSSCATGLPGRPS